MVEEKKSTSQKKLQIDLNMYLEFVDLYKKDRSSEAKRMVEQIIDEENSIVVRIKRIQQLDQKFSRDNGTGESALVKEDDNIKDQPAEGEEAKRTGSLVAANFFNYIIFERSKLVNFGKRTQTMSFRLLGLKKELSAEAIVFWRQIITDAREFLLKQINYTLFHGWKSLDAESYNIIVIFNKFLLKFVKDGDLLDRNESDAYNLKVIESFIENYLTITHKANNKELLKESLYGVLFLNADFKPSLKDTMRVLEEIINTDKRKLCFFNIILSCYALYYNRFIKMADLINYYNIKEIKSEQHEFGQKTLTEIKSYMTKIDEEVVEIEDKLFYLKYIEPDLTFNMGKSKPWINIFNSLSFIDESLKSNSGELLEEAKEAGEAKSPYHALTNEIVWYTSSITEGFLAHFADVLQTEIQIIKDGNVRTIKIFNPAIFQQELELLESTLKDYKYMRTSGEAISVTFETYQKFILTGRVDLEKENRLCQKMADYLYNFKEIAYKLVAIVFRHHRASQASSSDLLKKYQTQNEPIMSEKESEDRLIPYAYDTITNHDYLDNKKILDVLNQIIYFAMNLIFLFKDNEITILCQEKGELIEKMDRYFKLKSKIA